MFDQWQDEKDMQELDRAIDPDGLDEQGRKAWNAFRVDNAIQCICGVPGCKGLDGIIPDELSEAERLSLLEPMPFDSGVCGSCGEFVAAGRLHEHRCR